VDRLNEPAFVRRLITGDVTAFFTLCNSLKTKLPEFIVREIGLNYSDAEEVASDTLYKVHSSITSFQPRSDAKLTTWIFEIAKNSAIDRKRKLGAEAQDSVTDQYHNGPQVGPAGQKNRNVKRPSQYEAEMLGEDNANPSLRVVPYKRAYDKLNEKEQDILRMKNVLTYEEISEVGGENVGTLRTRHSRALKRLRTLYDEGADCDE
jgi:RNA polymerase sigma factor (sigma-70 family)